MDTYYKLGAVPLKPENITAQIPVWKINPQNDFTLEAMVSILNQNLVILA